MKQEKQNNQILTFEEVYGDNHNFKVKVIRNGEVHELKIVAVPEENFEKSTNEYNQTIKSISVH